MMPVEPERDWKKESMSFDSVAEIYDTYRPGYPAALVESIITVSGVGAGSRLLEIGSGTGQATRPFAEKGYSILCIEPGGNLAAVAARRLEDFSLVSFVITRFEDWAGVEDEFDLVFSAQAFHWVPQIGYAKAAAALKTRGWLALFWNMYPDPQGGVFDELSAVYQECAPQLASPRVPYEELIEQRAQAIRASGYFSPPEVKRFPWSACYTTAQYLGLLNT